jgi:hypothetical protein
MDVVWAAVGVSHPGDLAIAFRPHTALQVVRMVPFYVLPVIAGSHRFHAPHALNHSVVTVLRV